MNGKEAGRIVALGIFLGIIALVLFFVGWTNLAVPAGKFAVAHVRVGAKATHGYKNIGSNGFVWLWQRVIPFGMKIVEFDETPHENAFLIAGSLPHSAEYLTAAPSGTGAFTFRMSGSVRYRLRAESAAAEMAAGKLRAQGLGAYYAKVDPLINEYVKSSISDLFSSPQALNLDSGESPEKLVATRVAERFKELDIGEITFNAEEIPDYRAYAVAKQAYYDNMSARMEAQQRADLRAQTVAIEQQKRLEVLGKYGEVLTKYPILLDFFALDQDKMLPRDDMKAFMPPRIEAPTETTPQP